MEGVGKPISVKELDMPQPHEDEVLIKQSSTGICYRDILTHEGFFPRAKFPLVPGHEISGTVVQTGSSVTYFHKGERVASLIYVPCGECEYCKSGRENLCPSKKIMGENTQGSYAEYIAVPERSLVKVPSGVPDDLATITACVTGMVYRAMKQIGDLREGQRVLITGSGGGVGSHAIQVAKILGAHVTAYTSSPWKTELIRSLGADEVVTSDKFDREIKETHGEGVDLVLENVGLGTFDRSLRALKPGGKMVVVGNIEPKPVNLPLGLIILKGNRIEGSISSTRKDMEEVFKFSDGKRLKAVVSTKISLSEIEETYDLIRQKKHSGRVLIDLERKT